MKANTPVALVTLFVLSLGGCGGGGNGPPQTYTVGGTVSGLIGSNLVLRINGGDDLPIPNNGTFTFPTRFQEGTGYQVSVFAQPTGPSQTCTASNASGRVNAANVSSVKVTCTTNKYLVGGSAAGLTGTGLMLQNNGGGNLAIPAPGPFVFSMPVASGGTYSVSVATQPTAPSQSCTVTNGSGAVTAADVTTVVIQCVDLPPPPPGVSVSPVNVNVAAGATQQFSATVTGTTSTVVTWMVNGVVGGDAGVGTISTNGLYIAPRTAGTWVISATSQEKASLTGRASVNVLSPHTIAVRPTVSGIAEFYDRNSGASWIARGNDFIRLANQTDYAGNTVLYHSTFNTGLYDPTDTENALAAMQASGYNAVRVFLNGCCIGSIGDPGGGLSATYIANVADFLSRAQAHGIYVIITHDWPPTVGGYDVTCPAPAPHAPQFEDVNALNLCAGAISAAQRFHHDFVASLIQQRAPINVILGYELRNEYCYVATAGPLSASSGLVTTANGSTYDMANATSRQQMMDNGLVYLTDQLRATILAVDPTALVTVGFFQPQTPNPTRIGDTRLISVYPAMANSTADFVDIHPYLSLEYLTLDQFVQNFGFIGYQQKQPVIVGEYGAFKNAWPTITGAATELKNWQIDGCGYGLKGWLLWTWDTPQSGTEVWNANAGDGSMNAALAPARRPDPCAP